MKELFRPDLKASIVLDDKQRVRRIRHTQEYWLSPVSGALGTASSYLNEMADVCRINTDSGNNGPEPTGLNKPHDGDDRMESERTNIAHAQDGIKARKPEFRALGQFAKATEGPLTLRLGGARS